jgi:ketosteroid isomerase-like protein
MKYGPMLMSAATLSLLCATSALARDQQGIDQIMALERSVAAAQTAPEISAYYSDDVHQFDPVVKAPISGKAAFDKSLTAQMAPVRSFVTTIVSLTADADGDLGYAWSDQTAVLTTRDGKVSNVHLWLTHILRKQGGAWKITHEQLTYLP